MAIRFQSPHEVVFHSGGHRGIRVKSQPETFFCKYTSLDVTEWDHVTFYWNWCAADKRKRCNVFASNQREKNTPTVLDLKQTNLVNYTR